MRGIDTPEIISFMTAPQGERQYHPIARGFMILYHGTSSVNLVGILSDGLKNPCLTDDEDIAAYYAECETDERGGQQVLLKVVIDDSVDKLKPDYPAFEEPLTFYRDDYASSDREWHQMIETDEIPYPSNDADWAISLEVVHSISVEGTIPKERITLADEYQHLLTEELIAEQLKARIEQTRAPSVTTGPRMHR